MMDISFKVWFWETAGDSWGTPPQQRGTTAQQVAFTQAIPAYNEKRKGEEKIPSRMRKRMKKAN
jgi:hypothetical protein